MEERLDQVLAAIAELLARIERSRTEITTLELELREVGEEYKQHLGDLNARARELDRQISELRSKLAKVILSAVVPVVRPIIPVAPGEESAPSGRKRDPRFERKMALVDHLLLFMDTDQSSSILLRLNAMVNDDSKEVGEMLELIPGNSEIWALQADTETLEEQLIRLQEWQRELEERTLFWQQIVARLSADDYYGLLLEKWARGGSWFAYLDDLAQQQSRENAEKEIVVQELQAEYEARHG